MEQMTLTEVVQDIHAMDEELWHYESRYGLRTRYFLELYEAGQLHDEDSLQTRDYSDWAACYASSYTKSLSAKHLRRRRSRPVFRCLI